MNKIDRIPAEDRDQVIHKTGFYEREVAISALTGEGIEKLHSAIQKIVSEHHQFVSYTIDASRGDAISWLHERTNGYGNLRSHPLFAGSPIFWNGILVRKMKHPIRFNPNTAIPHVTSANRLTATETNVTIANFASTHQVARSIFMSAQALAQCLGTNTVSGVPYSLLENTYNFGRNKEIAGEMIGGEAKLRFKLPNESGALEPTDFGELVIDSVVRKLV